MAGSARSMQMSMFAGLRVASSDYYPAHSKNGKNISQRLVVNAYMNIASKANDGKGRNEVVPFTIWGKLADTCAKSFSPGKEFNCTAHLHVYMGRVFKRGADGSYSPVIGDDGQPILTKKFSYTVDTLTFGEDSSKHIANEMAATVNGRPIRPKDWNVPGTVGYNEWRETLRARQAIQFNPQSPTFGYARVMKIEGPGIGAYTAEQTQQAAPTAAPAVQPAQVASTFTPPAQQTEGPAVNVNPGGFVIPAGV